MKKHTFLTLLFLWISLRTLAFDTMVPAFHWTLPTTLEGIRQECARLEPARPSPDPSLAGRGKDTSGRLYTPLPTREGSGVGPKTLPVSPEATNVAKKERYWTVRRDLTLASVPYIALGAATHAIKKDVRKVNRDINYGFHNKADDYVQYAPLALTWTLKATGYQGRSKWGRLLASNALSAAIMAGLVNGVKYTAKEMRPDGSKSNSFPSGHTATAFMAATILHKEYGLTRSLWFSVGGYAIATGIGAFRIMNNRHWVSDVMAGAGIGILSAELGYAISDLIFKDRHTLRREMENLGDLSEHPSFFSLQAGAGFTFGSRRVPEDIVAASGPGSIKHGPGSVVGAEAAYFINQWLGFGVRARISSTAVTPRWDGTEDVWTSGLQRYNPLTNQYERPSTADPSYRHGTGTRRDQLSSFDIMGGAYGQLLLGRRMSLGAKLLFGHRQSGDIWFWADRSGSDDDDEKLFHDFLAEMTNVETLNDINTYDRVQAIDLGGKAGFILGTGISFSLALKHNIVWRIGLDYDFTRARYEYEYMNFSLVDEANHYLLAGGTADGGLSSGDMVAGSFRRSLHQLTPHFGICFGF